MSVTGEEVMTTLDGRGEEGSAQGFAAPASAFSTESPRPSFSSTVDRFNSPPASSRPMLQECSPSTSDLCSLGAELKKIDSRLSGNDGVSINVSSNADLDNVVGGKGSLGDLVRGENVGVLDVRVHRDGSRESDTCWTPKQRSLACAVNLQLSACWSATGPREKHPSWCVLA